MPAITEAGNLILAECASYRDSLAFIYYMFIQITKKSDIQDILIHLIYVTHVLFVFSYQ